MGLSSSRAFVVFLALLGTAATVIASDSEVVRLPTVMPPGEPYPGVLTSHPEDVIQLEPPEKVDEENIWDRPIDARNTFFQSLNFDATWLAGGRRDGCFGDTELELQGNFVLPLPSRRHPLLLMPGFAVHYLDGPRDADLPARLYDTYLQFRWLHKLSSRWSADLSVTPGVYSDFEQSSDKALRITGHFGAMWDWTPTTQIAMGVAYLDREDLRLLPFAGIIWEPTPDWKFNLMIPGPRSLVVSIGRERWMTSSRTGSTWPANWVAAVGRSAAQAASTTRSPTAIYD